MNPYRNQPWLKRYPSANTCIQQCLEVMNFLSKGTTSSPDPHFDAAMQWAEIAIEQAKVLTGNETSLVAGWYPSFDSARPGFGWYFGRDTLWTLYAVNSYGDKTLAKQVLEFLARRQRDDGKMMHEYSLTADDLHGDLTWATLGYEYAAADATPLFIMAVADYVRTTGDLDFLPCALGQANESLRVRPRPRLRWRLRQQSGHRLG
jgi:glycogen debranching enzyme